MTRDQMLQMAVNQHQQGLLQPAEAAYRQILTAEPNNFHALHLLGLIHYARHDFASAEQLLRRALQIEPRSAEAHYNLGTVLQDKGDLDSALAHLQQAVVLRPSYWKAALNLGNVLRDLGRHQESIDIYTRLVDAKPDYPKARRNLGIAWLRQGEFDKGWPEYEWRWHCDGLQKPAFPMPEWDGRDMPDASLLLYAEQGFGDAIQFVRLAPRAKEKVARTVLWCRPALVDLLTTCSGIDQVVDRNEPIPLCDVCFPLMSLPRLLQTRLETIPADVPYVSTDMARQLVWRSRLAKLGGPKVGICWQGSATNWRDRDRSVPVAWFATLASIEGISWVSLQCGPAAEQVRDIAMPILDASDELTSFADTAALIAELDLVITVDTAVAHLAGALAKPVWTLLPFVADWRWLSDRDSSPWYPSMRLFRQSRRGDWQGVFAAIRDALVALVRVKANG